ncbi:hypothetical protein B0T14DRAFT_36414 [Immersiella caudata]|uniref:Secreted protein n=1 Tax=Immersiella caudata TaxID=314043 RepID=A0AA39XEP9_9PEZI|nr:hypothetical protein B0T14DRAFT_36414 [Immersiella caudata]
MITARAVLLLLTQSTSSSVVSPCTTAYRYLGKEGRGGGGQQQQCVACVHDGACLSIPKPGNNPQKGGGGWRFVGNRYLPSQQTRTWHRYGVRDDDEN